MPSSTIVPLLLFVLLAAVQAEGDCGEWERFEGTCYTFSTFARTWEAAAASCRKRQGTLAVVRSERVQTFLASHCRTASRWIGLSDVAEEGRWTWVDGSPLGNRTFWAAREPNGGGREDCAEISKHQQHKWNDIPCGGKRKFICQKVLPTTPTITRQTTTPGPVADGHHFTLTCLKSSELKSASYAWSIDGAALADYSSDTLAVAADINDVHAYTCRASGDGGQSYSALSEPFTPQVVPTTPTITGQTTTPGPVADGHYFVLTCLTSSELKSASYAWSMDGAALADYSFDILTVAADINDVQAYTCTASADGGQSYSAHSEPFIPAVVPQTPAITMLPQGPLKGRDTLQLTCTTSSDLASATYAWTIDGVEPDSEMATRGTLEMRVHVENVVPWRCKVSADGGQTYSAYSEAFTPKLLAWKPKLEVRPEGPVTDGENVAMTCASSFRQEYSSYVWSVDGFDRTVEAGNSGLEVAADINSVHAYRCKMSVDGGHTYSEYSNEITPTVVPQTPAITMLPEGPLRYSDTLQLTCTTSSDLASATYAWTKSGVEQDSDWATSGTLNLYVHVTNAVPWRCKVSADGGQTYSPYSEAFTPKLLAWKPDLWMRPESPVTDGENVKMTCESSFPWEDCSYVYSVDGVDGTVQAGNHVLAVAADINSIHAYRCKMSVDGGQTYSEYSNELTPTVVPRKPVLTVYPPGPKSVGDNFTLTCSISSSLRSPRLEFFRWRVSGSSPEHVQAVGDTEQSAGSSNTLETTMTVENNALHKYMCRVIVDVDGMVGVSKADSDPVTLDVVENLCAEDQYTTIDDPARATNQSGSLSDNELTPGFYRFTINGLSAEIPTARVGTNHCGTKAPMTLIVREGWGLPKPGHDRVLEACPEWTGSLGKNCLWKPLVAPKNCGSFFIYWLDTFSPLRDETHQQVPAAYCARIKTV